MRRLLATVTTGMILGALATGASARDPDALTPAELLPLARGEGSVVVYSFTSRIAAVEAAFEAAYPGVDLQGYDISSTEQIARLKAEAEAGVVNADVVYVSDAPVVVPELVETGLLQSYVPPRVANRLEASATAPILAQRLSTKVLMYNEEAHPDGSPVTNLWQLTTPEWAGRVVMVDPLGRGDYLDLVTEIVLRSDEMAAAYEAEFGAPIDLRGSPDAGTRFIEDLFANDLILVGSTDEVNAAVGALGQAAPPVGFTSYSDRRDNADEGWALQVAHDVTPASGILFPAVIGLAADAPHPHAARLLVDFMMGDDSGTGGPGYAPFHVAGDYATRTDIAPHPDAVPLAELSAWPIDPAATAAARDRVGDLLLTLR